jgi:hypothetical protein
MTRHAVVLTDPVALVVGDAVLILVEAAQNPVRAPAGQEDETARRGAEGVALTADG